MSGAKRSERILDGHFNCQALPNNEQAAVEKSHVKRRNFGEITTYRGLTSGNECVMKISKLFVQPEIGGLYHRIMSWLDGEK